LKGLRDFLGLKKLDKEEFARIIITPLEVKTWLNDHDSSQWPNDLTDLIDMGLPMDIIDWLDALGNALLDKTLSDEAYSMTQIVKLWLEILALYPLAKRTGLASQQQKFLQRYYKRYPERELDDPSLAISKQHRELLEAMLEKLVSITSDHWPGSIKVTKAA